MNQRPATPGREWTDSMLGIRPFPEELGLIESVRADGIPRLRVYRVDRPMVVLGRAGRPDRDLHLDAVLAHGLPLFRRKGGGGAVVLTPDTVQVETAGFISGPMRLTTWLAEFSRWLALGLDEVGQSGVKRRDVCDLTLGSRKIAGACLYRSRNLVHYSVSILAQAPVELMERYLKHPSRQPSYRDRRSHADFVVSLGIPAQRLAQSLAENLLVPELFDSMDGRRTRGDRPGSHRRCRLAGTAPAAP